ncbi:MAG: signal peptidase II [Deltaproteobacteria bacterium]|jgi:signal peptidase II|nr:signal peptidase II [Deltaproteobacteria bacterium]
MSSKHKFIYTLSFAVLVFVLDILTKELILRSLEVGEVREVTGFFNLVLVLNTGAAFSLFSGEGENQGVKMALLSALAMVPLIFLYRLTDPKERLQLASLGIIFGGAMGNVHDRLRHSAVVDFLDFHLYDSHWPAFNVADIAVVAGLFLFVLSIVLKPKKA